MPKPGLIGSGLIGSTIARQAAAAGIDVVLSNPRGPHTLSGLVAGLGDRARAATAQEAAETSDLVVVSVPVAAYRNLPAGPLAGKTVLDTLNYYPLRDGRIPALDSGSLTSSELVQRHLAGSRVAKACNTIYYQHLRDLARPAGAPDRSALPVAGDDPAARQEATRLLDQLGWDTVDAGPLPESWRFQPDTPAYGLPYLAHPDGEGDLVARIAEDPGAPAPAERIRAALAAA